MDPKSVHELMGKPSASIVEQKVREASAEYRGIKDPVEAGNKLDLVATYLEVARYLEERSAIAEAKTSLAASGDAVARIKATLRDKERITVRRGHAEYQIIATNGEVLDAKDVNALGADKGMGFTVEMRNAIANRDRKAQNAFRRMCKDALKRDERVATIQGAVADISRVMLEGIEIVFEGAVANLAILGARSMARDYNARLELIKNKRDTAMDDKGICFVDGKQVPTFYGVK